MIKSRLQHSIFLSITHVIKLCKLTKSYINPPIYFICHTGLFSCVMIVTVKKLCSRKHIRRNGGQDEEHVKKVNGDSGGICPDGGIDLDAIPKRTGGKRAKEIGL